MLIEPSAPAWTTAARENQASLRQSGTAVLGSAMSEWRRRTRESIAGRDDAMIVVIGHQPEFLHAGVWAKRVVATRLAAAVDGIAINLIVDNDVPDQTGLVIPSVQDGATTLRHVAVPASGPASGG